MDHSSSQSDLRLQLPSAVSEAFANVGFPDVGNNFDFSVSSGTTGTSTSDSIPSVDNHKGPLHNVDICITCVTDKPPQLPLREELPSLGIEVVYNAHGVGAKASRAHAKKLLKKFRHDEQVKDLKKRRFFAPSPATVAQTIADRKQQEAALEIPRGISYDRYERTLSSSRSHDHEDSASLASSNGSTVDESFASSLGEKRKQEKRGPNHKKKKRMVGDVSPYSSPRHGGFPLKFSFQNVAESPGDSSNKGAAVTPVPVLPTRRPQFGGAKVNGDVNVFTFNFDPPPRQNPTTVAAATEDARPRSGFASGQPQTYQGPATKPSDTATGMSPSAGTATIGMFQSVLQAFSGAADHRQSLRQPEEEDDDRPPSVSESNSDSKSQSTTSGFQSNSVTRSRAEVPDVDADVDHPRHLKNDHFRPPSNRRLQDPAASPKSAQDDHQSGDPSSSRDPSSISTNFTKPNPGEPNPVEVAASDSTVKKYLPGLQTVPSASSYSSSVSNTSTTPSSHHYANGHITKGNKRGKHTPMDPPVLPPKDPPIAEAFAAFNLNSNDEIYESLGPIAKNPKRQHHRPPDPPHSPIPGEQQPLQHHQQQNEPRPQSKVGVTWMNPAKMALNVATEVYKQATGSSQQDNKQQKQQQQSTNNNQSQQLSPTSTLSSNTANQHQQQQIQIHGHKPFLFPSSSNNNNNNNIHQGLPTSNNDRHKSNNVMDNPYPDLPHVEVHVRSDGTQVVVSSSIGTKSVTAFYEALQQPKTPVDSIQRMLRVCPGLVKVRLQQSHYAAQRGRLGLHTACARGFPHQRITQESSSTGLALELVDDIQQLKKLIAVMVEANRGACTVLDDQGDLPAHLLARTLMEWEAQWYEKVYEKVQQDQDADGSNAAAITKLYQSMSQCIEIVLHPVAAFCNAINTSGETNETNAATTLCRAPGSVGLLLPLHIASIFTASVPTLRQLLEQDPTAATVPCSLGHLRTFIPDHSLPLELHDKLSTDFPKWEIGVEARKSKPIQIAGGSLIMEDYMRRSDLLFAFHPTLPRFRMETTRIERLEAKVIAEANEIDRQFREKGEQGNLSVAVKRIWIWLCTFQDSNDHFQATYYTSVKRILDSVPASTIAYLARVKTPQGKTLSGVAAPECQALLRTRMEELESSQASHLEQMVAKAVVTASATASSKSSVTESYDDTTTTNATAFLSLKGKGYVGVLCRTLFHVHEDSMPTSFILLPYKLTKNEHGKLGIDKQSSAVTAVRFAECLLQLTDPKTILYFLERKSVQARDHRISGGSDDDDTSQLTRRKVEEMEESLVALYESGKAYLYLIDELIGLPIVPATGTSIYPIELTQPTNLVRKLLPLMLTGMVLMRGEKALSVLVNVLLDKSVRHVSPNWVDAAREITAYLYSQQDIRSENVLPGLEALINELRAFVSNNSSVKSVTTVDSSVGSEWVTELSLLRMVVTMNDNKRSFAGLKAKRDEPGTVLWTKHRIEEEARSEKNSGSGRDSVQQKKKLDASPTGSVRANSSLSSSKASTKKSGNQSYDDISAKARSAKSAQRNSSPGDPMIVRHDAGNMPPISPLTESQGGGSNTTPRPQGIERDIERLRMQTTLSTPESHHISRDVDTESLGEADDSGFDGEELAGVRILQEAEEGPSLLDQLSTDDDATETVSTFDRYKTLFDKTNDSGNDSVRKNGVQAVPVESGSSDSGVDRKGKQTAGGKKKIKNDAVKKISRRPITKTVSFESGDTTVDDKEVYMEMSSSFQSGEDAILPGDPWRSGNGKQHHLDATSSDGSNDQMGSTSSNYANSLHKQASGDSDATSDNPSETYDTNETKSLATNESKGGGRFQRSESDDDDDEVLKFGFLNSDSRSQSSKSVPASMDRSAVRLYDEAHIEVIDHRSVTSEGTSVFSAGKAFENETARLQDYVMNRLVTSPSLPPLGPMGLSSESLRSNGSPSVQPIDTASTFGDLYPAEPIMSSPSMSAGILKNSRLSPSSAPRLSTRSSNATDSIITNRKLPPPIYQATAIFDSLDEDAITISPTRSRGKYGRENFDKKDATFMDIREQVADQVLKVNCLESTIESIRIREDKLLSRGMMLQDFLSDLLDQSQSISMDCEQQTQKVQRRLVNLEERLLCGEIRTQHLSLGVYALENETEVIADEDYKRELSNIIEHQAKQKRREKKHYHKLDVILGRTATVPRVRSGRFSDSDLSSVGGGYDTSMLALDGYNSSPDGENSSEFALDGYSPPTSRSGRNRRSRKSHIGPSRMSRNVHHQPTHQQRKPKSYNHHPRRCNIPSREYDMNRLLLNASMDERSIEYEMGLAMFGTLDLGDNVSHHSSGGGGNPSRPIRCNSMDAYEQMRSEYQMGVVSLHDDTSYSENGYSSAGDYEMSLHSLEGDGLDWVKMSARQFEVQTFVQ
jgi:hypothetical protein